jgi:Trk-type K+ transport system membrane component
MGQLQTGTILVTIFLMWIGASPSSTGGGIKTSTFAIATLNFLSLARGKNKLELSRREIPDTSIRRAFAIITLSFIVVGIATFTIAIFNPELSLLKITFECFSAYSTTGLSLGITSSLHPISKFVLILTMFTGRVTMLTILIAIMKKVNYRNYKYPTEDILIN